MEQSTNDASTTTTATPPAAPAAAPAGVTTPATGISDQEKQLAMLSHLGGLLTTIVVPVIIWQLKMKEMPFAAEEAKEALNFQIGVAIAYMIAGAMTFLIIGGLAIPVILLTDIVLSLKGAMSAKEGQAYRYPLNMRLVK